MQFSTLNIHADILCKIARRHSYFVHTMQFHLFTGYYLTPSQIVENLAIVSVKWANHHNNFAFE